MIEPSTCVTMKNTSILQTYACRLARQLYLQKKCGNGHPVLETEGQLVEMALSQLTELLLKSKIERDLIAEAIRVRAEISLRELVCDETEDLRKSILIDLSEMTTEEIFPLRLLN